MSSDDQTQISPGANGSSISVGTQLNGIYELDEHIASGGMGEVYRGHNIQTNDPVAIKIVLPEFMRDETILSLFRKEASILNHLSHDAIVRYHVFSVDPTVGRPYLAMEYVDGKSVADLLEEKGRMTTRNTRILIRRVANGLKAAHKRGVIHRDLSPDNIILLGGRVENAKIIDFGIAKSATVGGSTILGGRFAGKYNFVSPEQLGLFGGEVTIKSDIYSLGLVMAAALRGDALDMGGSQAEVVEKRRTVPDLTGVDPDMLPILEAMLQPDPADRPESMKAVATWVKIVTEIPIGHEGETEEDEEEAEDENDEAENDRTILSPLPRSKSSVSSAPPPADPVEEVPPRQSEVTSPPQDYPADQSYHPQGSVPPQDYPAGQSYHPQGSVPPQDYPADQSYHPQGSVPPQSYPAGQSYHPQGSVPPQDYGGQSVHPQGSVPPGGAYGYPGERSQVPVSESPFGPYSSSGSASDDERREVSSPPSVLPGSSTAPKKKSRGGLVVLLLLLVLFGGAGGAYYAGVLDPYLQPYLGGDKPQTTDTDTDSQGGAPILTPKQTETDDKTPSAPDETSPTQPNRVVDTVATRIAWLDDYSGGDCFYAGPVSVSQSAVEIEGYGLNVTPFEQLMKAFQDRFGVEPDIGVRIIRERQCSVAEFLRDMRQADGERPKLDVSSDIIKSGDAIRGSLDQIGSRKINFLLVDHEGVVYNLNGLLRGDGDSRTFNMKLGLENIGGGDPVPQMVVAITSPDGIEAANVTSPVLASELFPRIMAEVREKGMDAAAVARYFRLGG